MGGGGSYTNDIDKKSFSFEELWWAWTISRPFVGCSFFSTVSDDVIKVQLNRRLKWTRALRPSRLWTLDETHWLSSSSDAAFCALHGPMCGEAQHVSSMRGAMNLPLMAPCHMLWGTGVGWRRGRVGWLVGGREFGGFHTDRISVWKWLTTLYVSDVLWMFYISWEGFFPFWETWLIDRIRFIFPQWGRFWLGEAFVDCCWLLDVKALVLLMCVFANIWPCVCARACITRV